MRETFNLYRSLIDGSSVGFSFRKIAYEISRSEEGWRILRYNTRKDYYSHRPEAISSLADDPVSLIRTFTIEGITIANIFRHHESEMVFFDREYSYAQLLADLGAGAEIEFSFMGKPYALLNWAEGWEFSTRDASVTMKDVLALVDMIKIEGKTLRELFDHCYRPDNKGELVIDGLSHSLADM